MTENEKLDRPVKEARKPRVSEKLDAYQLLRQRVDFDPKSISVESIREFYGSPAVNGVSNDSRMAMDSAFTGYDAISSSLMQHAADLGQYPLTNFVGYGVLQNIAQNGLIRACVQTTADAMTQRWIEITGGDESADKVSRLTDLMEHKYRLQSLFKKAFATVGYMGGALIFIDTGEEDTETPLVLSSRSAEFGEGRSLKFVVVDPVNCSPVEYNSYDPLRADYMKPRVWQILGRRVHGSRLITLYDNEPPTLLKPNYNFLGIPLSQILWDYVIHFNSARTEEVNLLKKLNLTVFKTSVGDILNSASGIDELDLRIGAIARYRDNDSVVVVDKEAEDVANITLTISGVMEIVKQQLEFVACIAKIPAVKLLGISPTGFNATGESDLKNFHEHIRTMQESHRDAVLTCLRAIQLSEYGEIDRKISFEFMSLSDEDRNSTEMSNQTRVTVLTSLLDRNVVSAEEVRDAVRKDEQMGLDWLDDEMPESNNPDGEGLEGLLGGGIGGSNEVSPFGDNAQEPQGNGFKKDSNSSLANQFPKTKSVLSSLMSDTVPDIGGQNENLKTAENSESGRGSTTDSERTPKDTGANSEKSH